MRIVVLGARGGVGRQAVRQGVERGHEVVAVARGADPSWPAAAKEVVADVADADADGMGNTERVRTRGLQWNDSK